MSSELASLQFKIPWHCEDDHLGVFPKVSFWTLSDIIGPWHYAQGFQSKFGVVARRAWDAGQGFLQQLIHYEREISRDRTLKLLTLRCIVIRHPGTECASGRNICNICISPKERDMTPIFISKVLMEYPRHLFIHVEF